MKKRWLLYIFILVGCTNNKHFNSRNSKLSNNLILNPVNQTTESKKIKNNFLYGKWCSLGEDESLFNIDSNEIFYYEEVKSYKYTFSDNMLTIKYDDYNSISKIVFKGLDTLIMIGYGKEKGINDTLHKCSK